VVFSINNTTITSFNFIISFQFIAILLILPNSTDVKHNTLDTSNCNTFFMLYRQIKPFYLVVKKPHLFIVRFISENSKIVYIHTN